MCGIIGYFEKRSIRHSLDGLSKSIEDMIGGGRCLHDEQIAVVRIRVRCRICVGMDQTDSSILRSANQGLGIRGGKQWMPTELNAHTWMQRVIW